ncbi:Replicative DNA helicase (DnaB) [Pseudonocardia sp. Ae168_Ps1]|uniref:DnaB-like helicase N-terminal domain-containing protein n=1 Tax=unclassified Pseudonocardia TaxID=2619320 RepID=UPI000968278F|nr:MULTISPECIES: DnaB-like helicase N-terminal domain-containing protein [unclassified Pseudonocardia]OLL69853.1 Replicative DNA helicase (DnaB) [Pseudonocardia sp. Ae150A_Ps1]OLL69986.1 Replicative DNA helicase (DnaB) [Pseudonocardia sp. Ae168_Ps1]OLL89111.1 Replicative DNA helicase (DnaB) [Pseudonocardia sp. Ae356_Ps1]
MTRPRDDAAPLPAHDTYAEQVALGLILHNGPHGAAEAATTLATSDFYNPKHQIIYAAITTLHHAGDTVTPVTVLDALRTAGDLDRIGGGTYLFTLMDSAAPGTSITRTAEIITAHSARRRATDGLTRAHQLVTTAPADRLADILARARDTLTDLDIPAPTHGWATKDLTDALAGLTPPATPTIGARTDGAHLFYPGRIHSIAAAPEAGKSWLALHTCAQHLTAGHHVLYIDFEDNDTGIVGRLLDLGAAPPTIRDHFSYIRPTDAVTSGNNQAMLDAHLHVTQPTIAVLDGVTEAMALHGLDLLDNTDIARFTALLPRRIADTGAAVICLDHIVKARDGDRRYAIGGQHKLAAIDGAAYILDNRHPFGTGRTGTTTILIAKDRPGQLRQKAWRHETGMHWYGDLVLESVQPPGRKPVLNAAVVPPATEDDRTDTFRPTVLMGRVSKALTRADGPLTVRGIIDRVKGRGEDIRAAIAALVDDGYIAVENGPRGSYVHVLLRPFEGASAGPSEGPQT